MKVPIKCQVCPYFYDLGDGYECQHIGCVLKDDEKLRKEVYKALESLGENK